MQAGNLKHSIIIKQDTSGGTTDPTWATLYTIKAAKNGFIGRLFYAAAAAQSENEVIFTIRYRSVYLTGIRPKMQIVSDRETTTYEITAEPVDKEDKHCWIEIHAKRVV